MIESFTRVKATQRQMDAKLDILLLRSKNAAPESVMCEPLFLIINSLESFEKFELELKETDYRNSVVSCVAM